MPTAHNLAAVTTGDARPDRASVRLYALAECEPDTPARQLASSALLASVTALPAATERTRREEPVERGPSRSQLYGLLRGMLEALDGRRPVEQLRTRFTDPGYRALVRRIRAEIRGERTAARGLRRVHTCRPARGVIEACATIQRGGRVEAIAARIESDHRGWKCTAVLVL